MLAQLSTPEQPHSKLLGIGFLVKIKHRISKCNSRIPNTKNVERRLGIALSVKCLLCRLEEDWSLNPLKPHTKPVAVITVLRS